MRTLQLSNYDRSQDGSRFVPRDIAEPFGEAETESFRRHAEKGKRFERNCGKGKGLCGKLRDVARHEPGLVLGPVII